MGKARYPVISENDIVQQKYETLRRAGESHTIAEICATKVTPGTGGTDKAYWEGYREQDDADAIVRAKRAGVNCTGKRYVGGFGRPEDQHAWVSDLGEAKRHAVKNDLVCTGIINTKGSRYRDEQAKPYRVADDIVARETASRITKDPSLASHRKELAEQVRKDLSPKPRREMTGTEKEVFNRFKAKADKAAARLTDAH